MKGRATPRGLMESLFRAPGGETKHPFMCPQGRRDWWVEASKHEPQQRDPCLPPPSVLHSLNKTASADPPPAYPERPSNAPHHECQRSFQRGDSRGLDGQRPRRNARVTGVRAPASVQSNHLEPVAGGGGAPKGRRSMLLSQSTTRLSKR